MLNNVTVVARFFEEFNNAGKMELAAELFAAGHVYHDPSSPWVGSGPAGMRDLIGAYRAGVPNAQWIVKETLVAGDRVITLWTGRGTQTRELLGIPPTGKSVEVTGIWIHRIADGKIAESWNHWDFAGMLQQLGVAPAMAQAS